MIKYIKRKNLDIDKYNHCIENCLQSRVYAFSWYLDIVADYWDVLVLEDYKAVMPIPWKKKYGIKYVTQPHFCQQLGIFSIDEISKELQKEFLKNIPKNFLKVSLSLNADNFKLSSENKRVNYFIELTEDYKILFKNFSKGRKHAIKVGEKSNLEIKKISLQNLIEIQKKNYDFIFSEETLLKLAKIENKKSTIKIKGVFKDNILLGGAFFIDVNARIIYLFSAFTEEGRKHQAASFLISEIIKNDENSNKILDFEGGNIDSIGKFYRSFGATEESYSVFKRTFL